VTTILGILDKPALVQWSANCAVDDIAEHLDELRSCTPERAAQIVKASRSAHRRGGRKAMDTGTLVHDAIETHLAGGDPSSALDGNEAAANAFLAWLEWAKHAELEPLHVERQVVSRDYRYAGTADLIGRMGDTTCLLDWKSSKGIYAEYLWQVCAYAAAYTEETRNEIAAVGVVRLDKETGMPECRLVTDRAEREAGWTMFRAACGAWHAREAWKAVTR
jgi:hypothetical protein